MFIANEQNIRNTCLFHRILVSRIAAGLGQIRRKDNKGFYNNWHFEFLDNFSISQLAVLYVTNLKTFLETSAHIKKNCLYDRRETNIFSRGFCSLDHFKILYEWLIVDWSFEGFAPISKSFVLGTKRKIAQNDALRFTK